MGANLDAQLHRVLGPDAGNRGQGDQRRLRIKQGLGCRGGRWGDILLFWWLLHDVVGGL
jgi:hypothetical protein